ncbi:hypothetical protein GCM10020255_093760 [Rhodococcus baikonurensis]
MSDELEVLIEKRDGLGLITLNRPKAINALNHSMVKAMAKALEEWKSDDDVKAVVLTGAGERGLCAGGDIVSIYHDAKDGKTGSLDFWREEYILNSEIANYPKPYVAIMDGIVMGGGVGVSAHGDIRIVTERSMIGMPETGIGFIPDVGGTYLLSRAPGELGTHIALTTARLSAGDAIAAGFADHFIPSENIETFIAALASSSVADAVAQYAEPAPVSELLAQQSWIDAAYSADDVSTIVDRLRSSGIPEAEKAAEQILGKSPIALSVTLRSLRHAKEAAGLEEVLNEEFRVSTAALASHDLVEGIRAQVVEKDRNPKWSPQLSTRSRQNPSMPTSPRWATTSSDSPPTARQLITAEGASLMSTIGFIGLGHMGGPMAANLVKAGHKVVGFDLAPAALEQAVKDGASVADSAVDAVRGADVVITMLPSGKHVLGLYEELLPVATPGTLFIDCSTIDVADAREAHDKAEAAGHRSVDAPVSGGVVGATAGTLAFMVGGSEADFQAASPLLDVMGRKVVHCGDAGVGQAAKICNNMILGISMIAISEAFVLGEKLGLSNQALFDVASNASGQCWALTTNCPVPGPVPTSPANNDYQPGFAVALMDKDLGLAANALRTNGVDAEIGLKAAELYSRFHAAGGGGQDFSAIINDIRDRSTEGQQ